MKYYDDFIEKIPREEVLEISKVIKKTCRELFKGNIKVTTCGSYRRGKAECGDVDILLTTRDEKSDISDILPKLTRHLERQRFLKEKLGAISAFQSGSYAYMGVCKLAGDGQRHRRIDIKAYPPYQYGYAIMYFTGSFQLNIAMRQLALACGFSLSDAGLYKTGAKVSGSSSAKKEGLIESLALLSNLTAARKPVLEWDIFCAFGMKFLEPAEREADRLEGVVPEI